VSARLEGCGVWAIVPAAGRGTRFESPQLRDIPKQYAPLLGGCVLQWALTALLAEPRVRGVVVPLSADDARWPGVASTLDSPKLYSTRGGATRQESVIGGIEFLTGRAAADDWVVVHDAARPCLTSRDLGSLLDVLDGGGEGAILAAPIVDTVKREREGRVQGTVDRGGLWRALTPQAFRYGQLARALRETVESGASVTDEAQAMERLGVFATLVAGSPFNIKVTLAADLDLAEAILKFGR
jgi:2-C-methyl-D-erythritol 4-phosphate cytidylyltransferase